MPIKTITKDEWQEITRRETKPWEVKMMNPGWFNLGGVRPYVEERKKNLWELYKNINDINEAYRALLTFNAYREHPEISVHKDFKEIRNSISIILKSLVDFGRDHFLKIDPILEEIKITFENTEIKSTRNPDPQSLEEWYSEIYEKNTLKYFNMWLKIDIASFQEYLDQEFSKKIEELILNATDADKRKKLISEHDSLLKLNPSISQKIKEQFPRFKEILDSKETEEKRRRTQAEAEIIALMRNLPSDPKQLYLFVKSAHDFLEPQLKENQIINNLKEFLNKTEGTNGKFRKIVSALTGGFVNPIKQSMADTTVSISKEDLKELREFNEKIKKIIVNKTSGVLKKELEGLELEVRAIILLNLASELKKKPDYKPEDIKNVLEVDLVQLEKLEQALLLKSEILYELEFVVPETSEYKKLKEIRDKSINDLKTINRTQPHITKVRELEKKIKETISNRETRIFTEISDSLIKQISELNEKLIELSNLFAQIEQTGIKIEKEDQNFVKKQKTQAEKLLEELKKIIKKPPTDKFSTLNGFKLKLDELQKLINEKKLEELKSKFESQLEDLRSKMPEGFKERTDRLKEAIEELSNQAKLRVEKDSGYMSFSDKHENSEILKKELEELNAELERATQERIKADISPLDKDLFSLFNLNEDNIEIKLKELETKVEILKEEYKKSDTVFVNEKLRDLVSKVSSLFNEEENKQKLQEKLEKISEFWNSESHQKELEKLKKDLEILKPHIEEEGYEKLKQTVINTDELTEILTSLLEKFENQTPEGSESVVSPEEVSKIEEKHEHLKEEVATTINKVNELKLKAKEKNRLEAEETKGSLADTQTLQKKVKKIDNELKKTASESNKPQEKKVETENLEVTTKLKETKADDSPSEPPAQPNAQSITQSPSEVQKEQIPPAPASVTTIAKYNPQQNVDTDEFTSHLEDLRKKYEISLNKTDGLLIRQDLELTQPQQIKVQRYQRNTVIRCLIEQPLIGRILAQMFTRTAARGGIVFSEDLKRMYHAVITLNGLTELLDNEQLKTNEKKELETKKQDLNKEINALVYQLSFRELDMISAIISFAYAALRTLFNKDIEIQITDDQIERGREEIEKFISAPLNPAIKFQQEVKESKTEAALLPN